MRKVLLSIILAGSCSWADASGPDRRELSRLDRQYRDCQAAQNLSFTCAQAHFRSMNLLMQEVILDLLKRLNPEDAEAFRAEQKEWEGRRDTYFRSLEADRSMRHSLPGSPDEDALLLDGKAKFVRERVRALMAKSFSL